MSRRGVHVAAIIAGLGLIALALIALVMAWLGVPS